MIDDRYTNNPTKKEEAKAVYISKIIFSAAL